jgi:hypothetical protein
MYYFSFVCPKEIGKKVLSLIPYSTSFCCVSFDNNLWYCIADKESDFKEVSECAIGLVNSINSLTEEELEKLNPINTGITPLISAGNEDLLPWLGYS